MTIVGISGSPIPNGNTDRMTKAILEESGKEAKFINLSTLSYTPCRACALFVLDPIRALLRMTRKL